MHFSHEKKDFMQKEIYPEVGENTMNPQKNRFLIRIQSDIWNLVVFALYI